jgi:hypothetical protein
VGVTVSAYKFLDASGLAPFTGFEWTVGEWVDAGTADPCHSGCTPCRAADVSHWIAVSMWHVELDGEVVDTRRKVVGARGRIVAPVDGYDPAMHELRATCSWQLRDRAVGALRTAGDVALAERFAAVGTLDDLAALGGPCDESTFAGRAAALAADCAYFAIGGVHAQAPFVAASSAGHAAAYALEPVAQSVFLAGRLRLA